MFSSGLFMADYNDNQLLMQITAVPALTRILHPKIFKYINIFGTIQDYKLPTTNMEEGDNVLYSRMKTNKEYFPIWLFDEVQKQRFQPLGETDVITVVFLNFRKGLRGNAVRYKHIRVKCKWLY